MFKCKKCGTVAYSKCPSERSVFLDDTTLGMLSHLVKEPIEPRQDDGGVWHLTMELRVVSEGKEPWRQALRNIASLTPEQWDALACHLTDGHHWVGKCDFGHNHE